MSRSLVRPCAAWCGVLCVLVFATASPAFAEQRARMAKDLSRQLDRRDGQLVRVIMPGPQDVVDRVARDYGLQLVKRLRGGGVLVGTAAQLDLAAGDAQVGALALDRIVAAMSTVDVDATGAPQVWSGKKQDGSGFDGSGVGVAVIDSGVAFHQQLLSRVYYAADFVGDSAGGGPSWKTGDPYGHGTHVAGIVAQEAPGAHMVSLRVLGEQGQGLVSDVIEAIDWAIEYRTRFKLRVINLSLGHPAEEAPQDDPLVQAVERANAAGLVVVASAGNFGKLADGTPVIGAVGSPGVSADAITVGAINTHGTVKRSDDTVTSWSSRGPVGVPDVPSEWLVKPDVVAPGNAIVSAASTSSYLWKTLPEDRRVETSSGKYLKLSGSSMATAFASASAALLLDARKELRPDEVKFALQVTAQLLPGFGLIEQGAGSVNVPLAVALVMKGPADAQSATIDNEKVSAGGISFDGQTQGTLIGSTNVSWFGASMLGTINVWGDTIIWGSRDVWGDTIIWGSRGVWGDTIIWGSRGGDLSGDTIIWGSRGGAIEGDTIIWGSRGVSGDTIIWGSRGGDVSGDTIIWGSRD